MAAPKLSAPITLRELATDLGWPHPSRASSLRRLRRLIVRRERRLRAEGHDVTLYHCDGARSPGYVTRAELLGWMPELRDSGADLVAAVRDSQDELRTRVAELRAELRGLARLLAERVGGLEGRVLRVERRA